EPVAVGEQRRRHGVPALGAPVVRGLIDHREAQRMIEILVVELSLPLEYLVFAERRPQRQAATTVLVVPLLPELRDGRVLLSRIGLELLQRQRPRQLL